MNETLIIIFALLLIYYLIFLYRIYQGLSKLTPSVSALPEELISVIIPFRNEELNILDNLNSIQCQDYPRNKFEVIYVNDSSSDNSLSILSQNITRNNIRIMNNIFPGKKQALLYGIECAKGEIIVTTDSDCTYNRSWLSTFMKSMSANTAMTAGAVRFYPVNGLFEEIQTLEFAALIIAGAGLIGIGTPIICNGANLAYRKKVFNDLGGFKDNLHLASGDDEFLMRKIKRETDLNIKFSAEKESVVYTRPNSSLGEFLNQRKRWGSKGLFYEWGIRIQLTIIFLFFISLLLQLILGIFSSIYLLTFSASFSLKAAAEYLIMKKGAVLLFDKKILRNFLITELLHIPYIIFMPLIGTFGGFRWKNRKIKR
jgi:poly-beta-1,6-N-acetyl-D-glucosamine synthase